MGRRSRRRSGSAAPTGGTRVAEDPARGTPPPRAPRRRARLEEAPKPPWAPVPLTELAILVGLIVLVVAVVGGGPNGVLLAFGLTLVGLATLELALREHLAGYRSHSALLAALLAAAAAAPVALVFTPPRLLVIIVAALVFLVAFQVLRTVFAQRSGGMSWRA